MTKCMCDIIDEVRVDGDREAVFHTLCGGLLGFNDEFPLHRTAIHLNGLKKPVDASVDYRDYQKWATADELVKIMDDWLVKGL